MNPKPKPDEIDKIVNGKNVQNIALIIICCIGCVIVGGIACWVAIKTK